MSSIAERVLLNIEIRNRLRLGSHFEVEQMARHVYHVQSLYKNRRRWVAVNSVEGFIFLALPPGSYIDEVE